MMNTCRLHLSSNIQDFLTSILFSLLIKVGHLITISERCELKQALYVSKAARDRINGINLVTAGPEQTGLPPNVDLNPLLAMASNAESNAAAAAQFGFQVSDFNNFTTMGLMVENYNMANLAMDQILNSQDSIENFANIGGDQSLPVETTAVPEPGGSLVPDNNQNLTLTKDENDQT